MRQWIGLACALACAGCQTASAPPPETAGLSDSAAIAMARAAVIAALKDPASAQFGPMRRASTADPLGRKFDVVCGTVNARNSFGGLTGQKPFAYNLGLRSLSMWEGGENDRLAISSLCG